MAGTTSQDLLSLLMGGGSSANLAAPSVTQNGGSSTPAPQQQPQQQQQPAAQQPDLLAALFNSAKLEQQSSSVSPSLPPTSSNHANQQASLLGSFNSPSAPSKMQLNGPGQLGNSAGLSNEAGKQLLGLLTGMTMEKPAILQEEMAVKVEEPSPNPSPVPEEPVSGVPETSSMPVATELPIEQARKPSPFSFISPFDTLDAMTAKARAASSPAPSLLRPNGDRPLSSNSNDSLSNLPPLPRSPAPSSLRAGSRAVSIQDLFAGSALSAPDEPQALEDQAELAAPIPEGLADQAEVLGEETRPHGSERDQTEILEEEAVRLEESETPYVDGKDGGLQNGHQESGLSAQADSGKQAGQVTEAIVNGELSDGISEQRQNGLPLLPDSKRPQVFSIDVTAKNDDLQTSYKSDQLAISRFSVPLTFTSGRQIAMNGLISYATKAGRVRVIDPQSGARLIKKLHSGIATDMVMSAEIMAGDQKVRRLASCSFGKMSVWQMRASFDVDEVPSEVILALSSIKPSFTSLQFSPTNADLLACATKEKKVVLLNLASLRGTYNGADAVGEVLASQQTFEQSAAISSISFSQDGSVLTTLTEDNMMSFTAIPSGELLGATLLAPTVPSKASEAILLGSSVLAVARSEGKVVEIFGLSNLDEPAVVVQLSEGFGHISYLSKRGVLAISNSTGSIYLLALELPASRGANDAHSVRAALAGRSTKPSSIRHVVEVPASSQVVRSLLHGDSIFYLHPEGFDQMNLDARIFSSVEEYLEEVNGPGAEVPGSTDLPEKVHSPNSIVEQRAPLPFHALNEPHAGAPLPQQTVPASPLHRAVHPPSQAQDPTVLLSQMQTLFVEQARMFETMLSNQQRAEKLRHDQILGFISDTLTANTRRMIESAVHREMEERLLPEILKAFNDLTRAVDGAAQTHKQVAMTQIRASMVEQLHPSFERLEDKMQAVSSEVDELSRTLLQGREETRNELHEILALLQPERSDTPDTSYEDMFLRGLNDAASLVALVDEAPSSRLARVFPPNAMPLISPANVLALTLHLSQGFAGGLDLGQHGRNRLAWMLACAQAFKYCRIDSKAAAYIPRVATGLMSAISERRRLLTNVEDVEACSAVLQAVDAGGYV